MEYYDQQSQQNRVAQAEHHMKMAEMNLGNDSQHVNSNVSPYSILR